MHYDLKEIIKNNAEERERLVTVVVYAFACF